MSELHKPVMLEEVLGYFQPQKNCIYVDCTLGSGGHSRALLQRYPQTRIIAFDQDQEAIICCKQKTFFTSRRITFINDNFVNFPQHLANLNINRVDGFLFDLGFSSEQLADEKRGFSYRQHAQLDMRMDTRNKLTARDIINNYRYQELVDIFTNYGEEKKAKGIAWRVCQYRKKEKITTTQQLVKIIVGCQIRKSKKHPARRVFQALRIAVNQELTNLFNVLSIAPSYLKKEGRIIVISYHSLEDRIVKQLFKKYSESGFSLATKKPLSPSKKEIVENHRARSGKMRVLIHLN